MRVRTTTTDGVVTAGVKRDALLLIDGAANVVIDLATVEFIDSSGVGLLVSLFKTVRGRGRRAAFSAPRPEVRRVMEIIKLDRIFELHADAATAVRALSG
jgi:anti-anti-sigma factor